MAGIGHNQGPSMERGHAWRTHQWRRAQRDLMPNTIPLMVVKMRMRRATELGLDYKAYAQIRQATGRDILALLFSSNALRIIGRGARMPERQAQALSDIRQAQRLTLVHRPLDPGGVLAANPELEAADVAPGLADSWAATRERLNGFVQSRRLSGDQVLIVGDAPLEEEWLAAARAAGYLRAERYFPQGA